MPRDDLSIDFVKRMPPGGEALDPALILEDWTNRVANLPEEIRFLQDEIADRDRQYNECIRIIEERDSRIQKFIKANGSHEHNPREDGYRKAITENFKKAEALADEKISLAQKMQAIMDRHTRQLDMQIKQLYDRGEPGFTDPDELPSLLRPSAANKVAASLARASSSQSITPAAAVGNLIKEATKTGASASSAGTGTGNSASASGNGRGVSIVQVRQAQAQQGHSASAPASPAATMILNRQARESSAGPGIVPGKRGPRISNVHINAPPASSGLARHSSLGPGTPKSHQAAANSQRAGSAGPRATTKGNSAGTGRKSSTPLATSSSNLGANGAEKGSGSGRKKGGAGHTSSTKTSLSRVKRPAKSSAASSTGESDLSDAGSSSDSNTSSHRGTPARGVSQTGSGSGSGSAGANDNANGSGNGAGDKEGSSQPLVKREKDSADGPLEKGGPGGSAGASGHSGPNSGHGGSHHGRGATTKHGPGRGHMKGAPSSDDRMDLDDEEAGDDRKYCLCQNVSFGDMVACDNEDCPFEWFHWSCVGLKSEPNGTWFCPVCTEKTKNGGGVTGSGHHASRAGNAANGTSGAGSFPGGNGSLGPGGNSATGPGSASTAVAGPGGNGIPAVTKKGK